MSAGASPAEDEYTQDPQGPIPEASASLAGPGLVDLGQVPLAKPQVLRRDLEQLVVREEVERLLQAQPRGRRQPDRDVRGRRADVRLLLLAADVDPDVARPLLDADDHALVHLFARLDEGRAALLRARQPEGQRRACRRRGQRAVALLAEIARPRPVADADRAHQPGARGEGQEGVAEPDQPASRDEVLEPHAALPVVDDLDHLAAPLAERLGDRAEVLLAHVDREVLDRLHALAVDPLDDGLGPGDLELVALAPHRLDEHREVQLAAAADQEALGRVGVLDVQPEVGVELLDRAARAAGAWSRTCPRDR